MMQAVGGGNIFVKVRRKGLNYGRSSIRCVAVPVIYVAVENKANSTKEIFWDRS
jgi:hypothetical protein